MNKKRNHTHTDNPSVAKLEAEELSVWQRTEGKTDRPRKGGAPVGNLNSLTHGIFANQCLNDEERDLFKNIIARLCNDFVFNKSSDFLQVELVGIYSVKLIRAQIEGNSDAAERLDRMIRCHLKDLKTTKIAREGEAPKGPEVSPADWATALLEKVAGVAPVKKLAEPAEDEKLEEDGG